MSQLDLVAFIPLLIIGGMMDFDDYTSLNYYKYLDSVGRKIMDRVDTAKTINYWPKENLPSCKSGNEIYFG